MWIFRALLPDPARRPALRSCREAFLALFARARLLEEAPVATDAPVAPVSISSDDEEPAARSSEDEPAATDEAAGRSSEGEEPAATVFVPVATGSEEAPVTTGLAEVPVGEEPAGSSAWELTGDLLAISAEQLPLEPNPEDPKKRADEETESSRAVAIGSPSVLEQPCCVCRRPMGENPWVTRCNWCGGLGHITCFESCPRGWCTRELYCPRHFRHHQCLLWNGVRSERRRSKKG